jgi:guanylate kinase
MQKIVIVTAPSGAGKTSIVKHLLQKHPTHFDFSISAATRSPRSSEVNGKDYYFMTVEEFTNKIKEDAFIEWEMVYQGKYYGTLKQDLERIWAGSRTPILDIDVKGAIHIQSQFKENCITIFIEPPNIDTLINRLTNRGTETAESLQTRIDKANYELSFKEQFTYAVVNDDFEKACKEVEEIILAFIDKK